MKIGFVLPAGFAVGNPFNGIREQAVHQAEALAALGHDVVLMSAWDKYDLATFDVVQFFVGGPAMFRIEQRTPRPVKMMAFAPIIDTLTPNWLYRWAARAGNIHPKINTIQSLYAQQGRYCQLVIARSEFERRKLVAGLGIPSEKVEIVLNGAVARPTSDPEAARRAFDLPDKFLLHISRFTNAFKNVPNIIEGVGPTGLPLVIAGTADQGATLDRIRRLADKYPNIRLLGSVSDEMRNSLYAACHVFCLPSIIEGTGLVALEAAMHGASIVITANGGPPDYFRNFALYVHDGTPHEIQARVLEAWNKPVDDRLQTHVRDNLTWTKSAERLVEVYRKHAP